MSAETPKRPEPIVLISRPSKVCNQYTFNTLEELQAFTNRKPYSGEELLVMPLHARQFLGKQLMPARDVVAYVRKLVEEACEAEVIAASLASILLVQVQKESEQCAFWFISALSKLTATQPHLRLPEVLQFVKIAMPTASMEYARYAADKS